MLFLYMVSYIYFFKKNNQVEIIKKRKLPDREMTIEGNKYLIIPGSVFYRKKRAYLFFVEGNLSSLTSTETKFEDIQDLISGILGDNSIQKFLGQTNVSYIMFILIGLFALMFGIVIGISIYPHIIISGAKP